MRVFDLEVMRVGMFIYGKKPLEQILSRNFAVWLSTNSLVSLY